jgi:hypothetical protein
MNTPRLGRLGRPGGRLGAKKHEPHQNFAPRRYRERGQLTTASGAVADGGERVRIAHIGLHRHDLSRHAERLDMACEIGLRQATLIVAALGQSARNDMPAGKPEPPIR